MKTWAQVAQLIASQGLKGRFVARSVRGLPFFLEPGMEVRFVPPTLEGPCKAVVSEVEEGQGNDFRIAFKGISKRDTAELLTGSYCLVRRDDLPEGFENMGSYRWDILGFDVDDSAYGHLGTVSHVQSMPTQDLLTVSGLFGDVMIPAVDEFILAVDADERVVSTHIPSGLLDLDSVDCVDDTAQESSDFGDDDE